VTRGMTSVWSLCVQRECSGVQSHPSVSAEQVTSSYDKYEDQKFISSIYIKHRVRLLVCNQSDLLKTNNCKNFLCKNLTLQVKVLMAN